MTQRVERSTSALLPLLLLLAGCQTMPPVRQTRHVVERTCATGNRSRTYEVLVHLPDGYDAKGAEDRRWPLILYLPGMMSSGRERRNPIRGGPPMEVEKGRQLPAILLTVLTPTFLERFTPGLVAKFLDHAVATYRVDPDRVTITGVSLGGWGAWDAAQAFPNRIAAIAPVAAWGCPWAMDRTSDVAVWAFHGGCDFLVPPPLHERMVKAHRAAGGRGRWTAIPGGLHWIWDGVYARDELYDWLLAQRRPGARPSAKPGP